MQPTRFLPMLLETWSRAITRHACGKPLRRTSTENGNTRNHRFYYLRLKKHNGFGIFYFKRALVPRLPPDASRCFTDVMPPRCLPDA